MYWWFGGCAVVDVRVSSADDKKEPIQDGNQESIDPWKQVGKNSSRRFEQILGQATLFRLVNELNQGGNGGVEVRGQICFFLHLLQDRN